MRWSIACVTMDRPAAVQRFVRSARLRFPEVPIYVADQSATLGPMGEFYAAQRVTLVRMPVDAGLSASRNALIDATDHDYIALCDDDFVLGPTTCFDAAVEILDADHSLGVVGGMLHDLDEAGERIRNWEVFFDHDQRHGRFTVTPIYNYPPLVHPVAGRTLYACDGVLNFAVFRRELFARGVTWDARIKINGEHEDFYLTLKTRSAYRVVYLPTMAALHQPTPRYGQQAALRARREGHRLFLDKWRLTSHVEVGSGARPLDGTPASSWFETPASATAHRVTTVRADAPPDDGSDPVYQSFAGWIAPSPRPFTTIDPTTVAFRYAPLVDPDGDLVLWVRSTGVSPTAPAAIVLRWRSAAGDILVWESDEHVVQLAEDSCWHAIVARLPVWPSGSAYLRLDVIAATDTRVSLAVGFVCPNRAMAPGSAATGVLAWTRGKPQSVVSPALTGSLRARLADLPRVPCEWTTVAGQALAILEAPPATMVGLVSEQLTGAGPCFAAGVPGSSEEPVRVALPLPLVIDARTVVFANEPGWPAHPLRILEGRVLHPPVAAG